MCIKGTLSHLLFKKNICLRPTQQPYLSVADNTDDKVLFSINDNPFTASTDLQNHSMVSRFTKWRVKNDPDKFTHPTFTFRYAPTLT